MTEIKNIDKFFKVAEEVTQRFITLPENTQPDRTGGYIAVLHKKEKKMLLIAEFGICMPEKIKTCFKLCQEKVKRLQKHKDHHSSWQSRNVEKRKYGGAVTSFDSPLIGSISGFVEHGDEAIMLVIWHIMGWISLEEAKDIANFSSNNMFLPLLEKCKDIMNK